MSHRQLGPKKLHQILLRANQQQIHQQTEQRARAFRERAQQAQNALELTAGEELQVQKLEARDREVRAHEQAHIAASGGYARGGPRYTYQTGPDGRRYAVGGEVSIDTSEARTPQETIAKMRIVQRAALAPAEPSAADRAIAQAASVTINQAQFETKSAKRKLKRCETN